MKDKIQTQFSPPAGWRQPKTIPMQKRDIEWKERLGQMVEDALGEMAEPERSKHAELRRRLLSLGGEGVALHHEEDIDLILSKAVPTLGSKAELIRGQPCRCHANSGFLYDGNKDSIRVVTGWALSKDGCWRQHTWAVALWKPKSKDGSHLIETTEKRVAYYGFVLTKKQCERWFYSNCI